MRRPRKVFEVRAHRPARHKVEEEDPRDTAELPAENQVKVEKDELETCP